MKKKQRYLTLPKSHKYSWGGQSKAAWNSSFGKGASAKDTASGISSIASGVTDSFNTYMSNSLIADTSSYDDLANIMNHFTSKATNNDLLMQDWATWAPLEHVTASDVRGGSTGSRIASTLGSTASGAAAGASVGGPWGAVIGGVIGLGSGIAGWIAGDSKAQKEADRINKNFDIAAARSWRTLADKTKNIDTNTDLDMQASYVAYGGPINTGSVAYEYMNAPYNNSGNGTLNRYNGFVPLTTFAEGGGIHIDPSKKGTFTAAATKHGMGVLEFANKVLANKDNYSPAMVKKAVFAHNFGGKKAFGGDLTTNGGDFTNGLTWFNTGGTHEQNPYNGVPQGTAPDGQPNLVEEGEVKYDDYIFSNRLKVPNAVRQKYRLKEGLTFADAAKKLSRESSERPNDPISELGLIAALLDLTSSQEGVRQKKLARELRLLMSKMTPEELMALQQLMQLTQELPMMGAFGGTLSTDKVYVPMSLEEADAYNAKGALDGTVKPTNEDLDVQLACGGHLHGDGSNLLSGVTVVGKKPINIKPMALMYSRTGTPITEEELQDYEGPVYTAQLKLADLFEQQLQFEDMRKQEMVKDFLLGRRELPYACGGRMKHKYAGGGWLSYLLYAPAVASMADAVAKQFEKPDYSNILTASNYMTNVPDVAVSSLGDFIDSPDFDRNYYLNQLDASTAATRRAYANTSGGNRINQLQGILAADYNAGILRGNLARQAEEFQWNADLAAGNFNKDTHKTNAELSLKSLMANQLRGIEAAKFMLLAAQLKDAERLRVLKEKEAAIDNFTSNMANIGEDYLNWQENQALLKSDVYGALNVSMLRMSGLSDEGIRKYYKAKGLSDDKIDALLKGTTNANGGRLKKRKKGLTF